MPSHRIRAAILTLAVPTLLALTAAPALAHNELESSTPATGAKLTTFPGTVVLTFAEKPDPRFVKVGATGPDAKSVTAGAPRVSGNSVTQPLSPGGAGLYTVVFRVVSNDGHPVQGKVTFTSTDARPAQSANPVGGIPSSPATSQPADPTPSTTPAARTASAATTSEDQGWLGYALAGAVAIALIGVAFVLVRRRSRPEA